MEYSIPHQYYSNYTFSGEPYNFSTTPPAVCTNVSGISMRNEETFPYFDNNNVGEVNMFQLMSCDTSSSISPASLMTPEQLVASEIGIEALPDDSYQALCDFGVLPNGGFETHYQPELYDTLPSSCRAYPGVSENLGTQGKPAGNVEETSIKVGRYSIEERKDRILRYLKKRNQRNFNKTIKYACRKTLADKRVRVRGRFAKNNEPNECENEKKTMSNNSYEENSSISYDDSVQMKYGDEDDWLEAAMSSLMYFPHISS